MRPSFGAAAVLVIGDCLRWNPVGFLAPDAGSGDGGGLARRRARLAPSRRSSRRRATYRLIRPGVIDPTAVELIHAVLDMDTDDDWRPALVAIAAKLGGRGRSVRP